MQPRDVQMYSAADALKAPSKRAIQKSFFLLQMMISLAVKLMMK